MILREKGNWYHVKHVLFYSRGFDHQVRQHSYVEICHEIISTAILPLPLIQVGQLSDVQLCIKY